MDPQIEQHKQAIVPVLVGLVVFFVFALGGTYLWAGQYADRIAPNVFIGPVEVS